MDDGFSDLNTQFLQHIQTLFTDNGSEDLSDRLRALLEEYESYAEKLIEEAGGAKPAEEEEEETAAAHDADDDEGGDEGNGDGDYVDAAADAAPEANFFGAKQLNGAKLDALSFRDATLRPSHDSRWFPGRCGMLYSPPMRERI